MARDANGNYTLPSGNPVVSDTSIDIAWANPTMDDLASEMTNSLDRNGQGGMLAPLKHSNGTKALPAMTYVAEPSSGWYRAAAGDHRFSVLNADILKLLAAGATVTGTLAVSGASTLTGAVTIGAGLTLSNFLTFSTGGTLTIATGVITAVSSTHTVAGEGATDDDLVTISDPGTASKLLILSPDSDSQTITVKSTGNIVLDVDDGDFVMNSINDIIMLLWVGSSVGWLELSRRNNGT